MREFVPVLLRLQGIDVRIRMTLADRSAHEEKIRRAEEEQAAGAGALKDAEALLKDLRKTADQKDTDVKGVEQEIQKFKVQLNQVKTNREYSTLLHEIAGKEADKGAKEDEMLRCLLLADEASAKAKADKEDRQRRDAAGRARVESAKAGIAEVEKALEAMARERNEVLKEIPADVLDRYERVFQMRGTALASADPRKSLCGGCHMELRPQILNLLLIAKSWVFCPSCNRLLYLEDKDIEQGPADWNPIAGEE